MRRCAVYCDLSLQYANPDSLLLLFTCLLKDSYRFKLSIFTVKNVGRFRLMALTFWMKNVREAAFVKL